MSTKIDPMVSVDRIAEVVTRSQFLEKKSAGDDAMIALLTKQRDDLNDELASAVHNFNVEVYRLEQERDAALKQAADVEAILNSGSNKLLEGLRRIAADKIPTPTKTAAIEREDARLPKLLRADASADRRIPPGPFVVSQRDSNAMLPIEPDDARIGEYRR